MEKALIKSVGNVKARVSSTGGDDGRREAHTVRSIV